MSKVSIVAKITSKPGMRGDFVAAMAPMMEHVESEEGTLTYILMEDSADENVVWMYEEYVDDAALGAHSTSDMMKSIGPATGQYLAGRPEVSICKPVQGKGL